MLRKNESRKYFVRTTTLACMVLHNICINLGDTIHRKLDLTIDPTTQERRDRDEIRKLLQMRECRSVRDVSGEAIKIRNSLCEKLWMEKETGEVY